MVEVRGLVLHIQDGTEQGSEAWFKNPVSQASSHFLNPKSGSLRQLIDTKDRAWAEAVGNAHWISVENEGRGGDALTDSQVENCGKLYAWLHNIYGIPFRVTDDVNGLGLGWHGMGGKAWGNHPDCPGTHVLAQRSKILAVAAPVLEQKTVSLSHVVTAAHIDPGKVQGFSSYRSDTYVVERALNAEGLLASRWVDGSFGSLTVTAYARWQYNLGYRGGDADGIPGRSSLAQLGRKHGFLVAS
jgi:hypothetical protein